MNKVVAAEDVMMNSNKIYNTINSISYM